MEKKGLSRKEFLSSSSKFAVGAVAGIAGLTTLSGSKLLANSNAFEWPYPYLEIDPEAARLHAHTLYYSGKDCSSGVFGGLVECLKETVGDPWTTFPIEIMLFGRGGGVGWGSICGTLNGAAALVSLVTEKDPSGALINEIWGWSTTATLPSDAANATTYEMIKYTGEMAQNISGSPLCHAMVSQWNLIAGTQTGDAARKERCARLAGDIAAKTAEVLNAHFASTFVGTFTDPETNATCMACHGSGGYGNNVMTHMECAPCHNTDPVHAGTYTTVETISLAKPAEYKLENAYPNPFNPSTKIRFSLPNNEKVRLEIYDIKGKLVNSLIDSDFISAGSHESTWTGKNNRGENVASGIYLARITTGNYIQTIKLNLIK